MTIEWRWTCRRCRDRNWLWRLRCWLCGDERVTKTDGITAPRSNSNGW